MSACRLKVIYYPRIKWQERHFRPYYTGLILKKIVEVKSTHNAIRMDSTSQIALRFIFDQVLVTFDVPMCKVDVVQITVVVF